jgi:hypothetical protein
VIGLLEMGDLFGTTATPSVVAAALRAYLVELGVEERLTTPLWTLKMQGTATRPATTASPDRHQRSSEEYREAGVLDPAAAAALT